MSLQDILQKLIKDAHAQADAIQSEFIAESKTLKAAAAESQKQAIADVDAKKEVALEKIQNEMDFLARKQNKSGLLTAKNTVITKALDHLVSHLEGLADDRYAAVLDKLIASLPVSAGTVHVSAKREAITKKAFGGDFTIKVDDAIAGGFVVTTGKIEIDCTFAHLVHGEYRKAVEAFFIKELDLL